LTAVTRHAPVELLAPAGNFEKLEMAVHFGADAVYLGGKQFSLRSHSGNFAPDELAAAVAFCRRRNVRAYITCNSFPRHSDLDGIRRFLQDIADIAPHGIIVADPGVFALARQVAPHIPIHVSTQANVTSHAAARFWKSLGAARVNAARELSLEEITTLSARGGLPVEVFVHGAMCMAYSGRCLLSSFLAGRDSNQGQCAHPCRWRYALVEEKRPGVFMPVHQADRDCFVLSARDLCMLPHIPALIGAGVRALKIEGRMKGIHYVATVVKTYREAIDAFYRGDWPADPAGRWGPSLAAVNHRGYDTGFYFGPPTPADAEAAAPSQQSTYRLAGKVIADSQGPTVAVTARNRFEVGDTLEVISPGRPVTTATVQCIFDADGQPTGFARPGFAVTVGLETPCRKWDLLRRVQMPAAD
jgi:putative protease